MLPEITNIAIMSSAEEYKNNLLKFDLQSFLKEYAGKSALKIKKQYPELYNLLAQQPELYPKAIRKLPAFTSKFCFLTRKSFEQASSEKLAEFKASLFKGNKLIDLTGGLGIDDIAFSARFNQIISVDSDDSLNQLAEVNFIKLGINNIKRISAKAEDYIKGNLNADLIYIDADRRTDSSGKRSVTLHGSSPDVMPLMNRLFEISGLVLLKLSPLIDITYLKKNLENIKKIWVVSFENEVKEILVLLEKNYTGMPAVSAIEIQKDSSLKEFSPIEPHFPASPPVNDPVYLFDPAASLIKAGLAENYAAINNLNKISGQGKYFTTGKLRAEYFGRIFRIVAFFPFGKSAVIKYLRENSISNANISASNFPVKPEEIKKTFALKDGGEDYFFFTTNNEKEKLFYHCRKL